MRFQGSHPRSQQSVGHLQVVQTSFQGSDVPPPTIHSQVEDSDVPVGVELLTLQLEQRIVQEKSSPLVVLIQVLDSLPLKKNIGLDPIPLSKWLFQSSILRRDQDVPLMSPYPGEPTHDQ